jgi:hypothetical protein
VKLLIVYPLKGALDQIHQLLCSTFNGLIQGVCLMCDRDGLAAFKMGFDLATEVVIAALLVAVLVAQVNIHLSDVFAESAESILYYAADLSGQRLMTFDVMVSNDLDLHGVLLL